MAPCLGIQINSSKDYIMCPERFSFIVDPGCAHSEAWDPRWQQGGRWEDGCLRKTYLAFPGVLRVGGPLHISTVPGQESFPGGSGSQLNGSGVWGSSPRDAASLDACLSTSCHVPHFTAFAAKTWNDSGLPLLRISQSSSTATRKFKQEYSGQAWELALPRTYLHSLGSFQRFGENFSME